MSTKQSAAGNVGCGTFLVSIFLLAFVATLGVRLALHILGL